MPLLPPHPAVRYTVRCTFPDADLRDTWLDWLLAGHAQALLAAGATGVEVDADDDDPLTVAVRYRFPHRAALDRYLEEDAPRLRQEGLERFPASLGLRYSRQIGPVVATLPAPAAAAGSLTPVFLHGLESGPHGSKYRALKPALPGLRAPDTEGILDPDARLQKIEAALAGDERLLLVGSSFGGLMACLYADRHPERVAAMVLCAPALHAKLQPWVDGLRRLPERTVILHGRGDDVVPIAASRRAAERFGVPLVELDDDHRLSASRGRIVAWACRFAAG